MTTKDPATRGALSRDVSMLAPRRPKITGAPKEAQPARSTQSASATLPAVAPVEQAALSPQQEMQRLLASIAALDAQN